MSSFVSDAGYPERVYAGVLGKIIGVYAGRPFEGWKHERILEQFGEIDRYVADELNVPLVVTDDDISGTFTFLRALADNDDDPNLTAKQVGESWLNYIIEGRTILWWGGIGQSTEHTAYLRLKRGIPAPKSGSIELNGRTVAEQIGAQIFIDGWGLICPGEPERAADFARRAASVSHDGEAIYGAQVVAALVAEAFVEKDINRLLDCATARIPVDSVIAGVIRDIRNWHASGIGWIAAFQNLKASHGYDRYPSNCHIVPNHGVVILALLYGEGDFSKSIMIANTCGWDTDCNSGNVGCIVGVLSGLEGIDGGYDWRGPIRDQLFLPTADGGRCVSDAVLESIEIVRVAHAIRSMPYEAPKEGARFSFAFPGSVQGFAATGAAIAHKGHGLSITLDGNLGSAVSATIPSKEMRIAAGYSAVFSPTLTPGQTIRARIQAGNGPVSVAIQVNALCGEDEIVVLTSEYHYLSADEGAILEFQVPGLDGYAVAGVGISVKGKAGDSVHLDWLRWDGSPDVRLCRTKGSVWRQAWVNGVSEFPSFGDPFGAIQNEGTGLLIYGCREWTDLCIEADLTLYLAESAGIVVRVQGMRRYYALRLTRDGFAQLILVRGETTVLAEKPMVWSLDETVRFSLSVKGNSLTGSLNNAVILEAVDVSNALASGAVGILLTDGRLGFPSVRIVPYQGSAAKSKA